MRTSGKTNNTPGWPNLHRTGPGRDKHIKRGAKTSCLSLPRAGALFSSCLRIDMPSCLKDRFSCYFLNKIELQHWAVTLICLRAITWSIWDLRAITRSIQELWCTEGALMSTTPNLCCDETKNRRTYTRVTLIYLGFEQLKKSTGELYKNIN